MYLILRSDLNWPIGSLIAQGCHATSKCLHIYKNDENVIKYFNDINNLRKVILKVSSLQEFEETEKILTGLDFVTWIEQPEGIKTAIAVKPYEKSALQRLKKLKLF